MSKLYNLAKMTTATTGTGTITLGSAVTGFLTFAQAGISDGDIVSYGVHDGSNREVGVGTYTTSGTTLTRTVINSTNSNTAISLSGSAVVFITGLASDFTKPYAYAREEKSQNTAGGTFTTGSWQTRIINTEVSDTDGIMSLSANQITLSPGIYLFKIRCPAYACDRHQARLQNVTDASTIMVGGTQYAKVTSSDSANDAFVSGKFTIGSGKALEVQHRCAATKATNGLGIEGNFGTEVYSEVEFWKQN